MLQGSIVPGAWPQQFMADGPPSLHVTVCFCIFAAHVSMACVLYGAWSVRPVCYGLLVE